MSVTIDPGAYIADSAVLIGDVKIESGVSIFDYAVLRGDMNTITIGEDSNIQDNVTLHVDPFNATTIGKGVSVGHNAVVHGACVGDYVIVGMGALVLNGANIGSGSVIAAGSVVTEGFNCGEDSLLVGVPARVKRKGADLREYAIRNYKSYAILRDRYLRGEIAKISGGR